MPNIPALLVDSGNFLNEERSAHGELKADARIQSEWVIKAYDQFPVDVANVSANDLPYVSQALSQVKGTDSARSPAILKRIVSANIVSEAARRGAYPPFVVREITVNRRSKPVRVAIIGLAETIAAPQAGVTIGDPIEAAKRIAPEARRAAEVVVVLAHVKADVAARIAVEAPGIDVLIAGNGELFTPPVRLRDTLIVFTPNETRMIGELRFYEGAKLSVKDRYISLEGEVPEDTTALEIIAAQHEARKAGFAEFTKPAVRDANESKNSIFAGSQSCSKCHLAQYVKWANTRHALSSNSLATKQNELDATCFSCHSGVPNQSISSQQGALGNVGCEICHGSGMDHVSKPSKGYGRISDVKAACSACHTAKTSPKFNFGTYSAQIKH